MTLNWMTCDYFALLLQKDNRSHEALELLVDDLHSDKDRTIGNFLCHSGSEDFLWGLVRLLGNNDTRHMNTPKTGCGLIWFGINHQDLVGLCSLQGIQRVAGNSAYILGTLAETDMGCFRVISLTKTKHRDASRILSDLTKMLTFNDPESMMNAAGTMGTLAESEEGRAWMLKEPCFEETLTHITTLLNDDNLWTASNAALVLARISISEDGTQRMLVHPNCSQILSSLVQSLGIDEAGRGMNAAFAIGRISDLDTGRSKLLSLVESEKMVSALSKMLCGYDPGASKNACFALSCLAADKEGHARILKNSNLEQVLKMLTELLSSEDHETGWFAAMTLKTLASQPKGCMKLREFSYVGPALKAALNRVDGSPDLIEEVQETIELLQRLGKPSAPEVEVIGSDAVQITWERLTTRSGLEIKYRLFQGNEKVYDGPDLSYSLRKLQPFSHYVFRIRGYCDGDDGPYSDPTTVQTEESVPGPPINASVIGRTATQLKVSWLPPEDINGVLKGYSVYNGKTFVEQTHDTTSIISGLQPATSYEIHVCAANSKGKGAKDSVIGTTSELGAHAPSKPEIIVRGRNELHVSWKPPEVPLGRITRYDLVMDGEVIYSGTELHHIAHRLKPDTEYIFVVCAITNEGKCESKAARKRTAKDEYDVEREPLYKPPKKEKIVEEGDKERRTERRNSVQIEPEKNSANIIKRRKSASLPHNVASSTSPSNVPQSTSASSRNDASSPRRLSSAKSTRKILKKHEGKSPSPVTNNNKSKDVWKPSDSLPPSRRGSLVASEAGELLSLAEHGVPGIASRSPLSRKSPSNEINISRSITNLTAHPQEPKNSGKIVLKTEETFTDSLPKPQPPTLRSKQAQLSKTLPRSTTLLCPESKALQRSTTSLTAELKLTSVPGSTNSTINVGHMRNNSVNVNTSQGPDKLLATDDHLQWTKETMDKVETFVNNDLQMPYRLRKGQPDRRQSGGKVLGSSSIISSNKWMPEIPASAHMDHTHNKFVPSQFRTQPANIPGGFQRQVTNLSLFDGGQPKLRIDLVSRSSTVVDKFSKNLGSAQSHYLDEGRTWASNSSVGRSSYNKRASLGLNKMKTDLGDPIVKKSEKFDVGNDRKRSNSNHGTFLASVPVNFDKSWKMQGAR